MAISTTLCTVCAAAVNLIIGHMAPGDVCRPAVEAFLQAERYGPYAGVLQARSVNVLDYGRSLDLNTYQATRSYDVTVELSFGVQKVSWIFVAEFLGENPHKAQFQALSQMAALREFASPLWYVYVPLDEEQKVAMVQLFARSIHGGCIEAPFFGVQLPLPRAGPP